MSQSRLLAVGSQRNSNSGTSDDDGGDGSTMLSALKKGDLDMVKHVIEPILEPLIRRIVKEELMQERILTSMNQNAGNKINCSESSLKLEFRNKLPSQILTGSRIIGENYSSIEIALVDLSTKEVVKHGLYAFAKVKIVLLPGDSDSNEGHDWTQQEMKENESLLRKPFLNLKEGIGSLDEISFAHRKKWTKKRMFRLGARIVDNLNQPTRVREAKSGPFSLEDCRNKLYEKHNTPSLSDEVWRLKNICKGGTLHKRLSKENIKTVEDFLKQFSTNCQGLRDILGPGMPDRKFNDTVKHARTCKLNERYLYPPRSPGISIDKLPETEKADAQKLVLSAECPSGPNVGTSHMIAEYDRTQPSTSQVYEKHHPRSLLDEAEAHKLVITAFEQWGDVVSFDDEASLMDGSLHSFNNDLHSNSAMVEKSDGCKILTSRMIGGFDYPQPSLFSPDITPSTGGMGDDFGFLHNIDNMDVRYNHPSNFSGQLQICETESITQTFYEDDYMQYFDPDCSLQSLKSSLESKAALHTSVNGVILTRSATFVAQRRWTVLISVLKWYSSIQRIVAKKAHGGESRDNVDGQPRTKYFHQKMQMYY